MHGAFGLLPVFQDHLNLAGRNRLADDELGQLGDAETGYQRRAVVGALVAQRDARVVPVLVRILDDSDPFGADHPLVLDTLGALSQVGDDQVVPALTTVMRKKKLFAREKSRALKEQALTALRAIKSAAAASAIEDAGKTGDRMLRKLARAGG